MAIRYSQHILSKKTRHICTYKLYIYYMFKGSLIEKLPHCVFLATTSLHHHISTSLHPDTHRISTLHHHITTSPHTTASPHHRISTSLHHDITASPHHRITTSFLHITTSEHITASPRHHATASRHHHIISTSPHHQHYTYFSWQVQYLMKLQCHCSWQGHYLEKLDTGWTMTFRGRHNLVKLQFHSSRRAGYLVKLQCAPLFLFVASAKFGEVAVSL